MAYLLIFFFRTYTNLPFIPTPIPTLTPPNPSPLSPRCPQIVTIPIDILKGVTDEDCDQVAAAFNLSGDLVEKCRAQVKALYGMFCATDATQVEINPLAVATDNRIYCVDAKLNFDDNAKFRQEVRWWRGWEGAGEGA